MKKATCSEFVEILTVIHEEGITNKLMLTERQELYTQFWLAVQQFCHYALLSKTTAGKNERGEPLSGNARKIDVLESKGAITRAEIEVDCAIKIIEKLDLVLRQPLEKQKNYCYVVCNNIVNDHFRKLPPSGFVILSLSSTVSINKGEKEGGTTYEDVIRDERYNPELVCVAEESVKELIQEYRKQQIRTRNRILREASILCNRPAELWAYFGIDFLKMKPSQLTRFIIEKGRRIAYTEVMKELAKQNGIEYSVIEHIIGAKELTAETVKENTENEAKMAGEISRLAYRAKKRLCKMSKAKVDAKSA